MPPQQRDPSYRKIFDFLDTYAPQGFENIDHSDPSVKALEKELLAQGQYLQINDLIHMKVLFVSSTCKQLYGLDPKDIHISTFFERSHPDGQLRHSRARSRTIQAAQDLYLSKSDALLHASDFVQRDAQGNAVPTLFQVYMFYRAQPHATVYAAMMLTDIAHLDSKRNGHHYYLGTDLSLFRYPDEALLAIGHPFSDREFEILELVAHGLESDAIAEKLHLSVNTVNTHRRNILRKSGCASTHDLVISLQESGAL